MADRDRWNDDRMKSQRYRQDDQARRRYEGQGEDAFAGGREADYGEGYDRGRYRDLDQDYGRYGSRGGRDPGHAAEGQFRREGGGRYMPDEGYGIGGAQGGYGRGAMAGQSGPGYMPGRGGITGEYGRGYSTGGRGRGDVGAMGGRGGPYGSEMGDYGAQSLRGSGYGEAYFGGGPRRYAGGYGQPGESRSWEAQGLHRGRGPKGYSRSNDRIREDISDRLSDDARLDASEIEVEVDSGEVTLSGAVDSRQDKRRAEDIAESCSGVSHVQNNLRVARGGVSGQGQDQAAGTAAQETATGRR